MSSRPVVTSRRQTQADRREQTKAQLLEATADCLAELGWSGTSTTEVARRAGVSRGAQQHHYRTKTELVVAVAHYLLQRQQREFEKAFAALPATQRSIPGAFDLLWSLFSGRTFRALFELSSARRTVPEVGETVGDLTQLIIDSVTESTRRLFPELADHPDLAVYARTVLALFTGLTLQSDGPTSATHKTRSLHLIRTFITTQLTPES